MSKNSDRDIVILETRPAGGGKDKSKDDSRRSGGDSRNNNKNLLVGGVSGGRDNKDHRKSSGNNNNRSSHRDRGNDRNTNDHRGNNHGGSSSGTHGAFNSNVGARSNQNTKFSGMAFTETELLNEIPKKKFTGRCRLFVGNLPNEVKESELKELFTPHGDISECYLSGKGFAFLRLDTRAHAESAKEALDGKTIHGRQIRVRFAVHGATIKVKELAPVVSNEMLYLTFSAFGEVERAVHIVDEKGKPTGEGIIEFERKASAVDALGQIKERVFLMTANSRPLAAELLEPRDEEDGLSEKMLQRTAQLLKERELGPRFAALNSFEYVYGKRWKELYEHEKKRRLELELELKDARKRLDSDMEIAYEDYKTQLLREDLQRRQQELERLEAAKRERMRVHGSHLGNNGGGIFGGVVPGGVSDIDRSSTIFGGAPRPGANGSGLFFGGSSGPGNSGSTIPSSSVVARSADTSKIADVQKILQTFKGDGQSQRNLGQQMDFFLKNGINDRHSRPPPPPGGGLPNHLLKIIGPFANALTGGPPSGPPPPRPPGGMPPPPSGLLSDSFQPPEKRLRR